MTSRVLQIENLSSPELEKLDREKTLFILTVSPLEEHGPHLPLGVDVFIAEYLIEKTQERILQAFPDFTIVRFPPYFLGAGGIPWLGTFNVPQRQVRALVERICGHLGRHGFRYVLLSNGHGGAGHVVALEEAARRVSRKYGMSVVSLSGRIAYNFLTGKYLAEIEQKLGRSLTGEERAAFRTDSHAGWWETSMMLLLRPELVKSLYRELPPFVIPRRKRLFRRTFPGDRGYRGTPALANREFAEATVAVLVEKSCQFISRWLKGEQIGEQFTSPLYKIPFLRTNFARAVALGLVLITVIMLLIFK